MEGRISPTFLLTLLGLCLSGETASAQTPTPEQLFQQALAAQQQGDDDLAVRQYQQLLRINPQSAAARVNLGAVFAHERHFQEAIEQYRIVLTADPNNHPVRMNLALACRANGDLPQAILEMERLRAEDPSDEQTVLSLAESYTKAPGRATDAISLLQPLQKAYPDNPDVQLQLGNAFIRDGHLPDGVALVERSAGKTANPDAWLLAGQTRFAMDQFDLARKDAEAAMGLNPRLPGLATLSGMILEQTADYDGAEAALLQALSADPDDFSAHFYLGANFYFKRNMSQAQLHLNRALQLQPTSAQARYELALVQRADGDPTEALKNLEAVVSQIPDWLQPHIELSALYYRLHRPEDGAREKQIVDLMMAALQQTQSQAAH